MTTAIKTTRRRVRKQATERTDDQQQHTAALAAANAGPELPTFWPHGNSRMHFWAVTRDDKGQETAYRILAVDSGWKLSKPDGTTYYVEDRPEGLNCDCPGCTAHGPCCAGGRGCKHCRMIRALCKMFV